MAELSTHGAIIKTAYEGEANTNAFTDAEQSKLAAIEALADVTDAANVAAAGAVMDGDFTANGAMRRTASGVYSTILDNYSATVDPTANEDVNDGYVVGSRWVNTTGDKEFVCVDSSAAAAVWKETTASGGGGAGALLAANNLSDVASVTAARTNLGLAIGTNVQAWDAQLDIWAGVTPSANGQSIVSAADYAAMRTLLNVENGATADMTGAEIAAAIDIQNATAAGTFAAGDKLLIYKAGVGNRQIDFNQLPSGGGGGLNNIVEDLTPQLGGALDVNGQSIQFPSVTVTDVLDEDTMSSNSATKLATQQSIKAYADSLLASAVASNIYGINADRTTASETFASTDLRSVVSLNSASPQTLTINVINAGVFDFPVGGSALIYQKGAGATTVAAGSSVTIRSATGLASGAQYSVGLLVFLGSNTWSFNWLGGAGGGGGALLAANNLSDLANAATARTNLGLAIGTNVQAFDQTLAGFAAWANAANKIPMATAVDVIGSVDFVDEDNFASNSATAVPSQQSTKAYVDNLKLTESMIIPCSDETTPLTAGTGKVTFRMPYAFTLTAVRASVTTAPTGSVLTVDINEAGASILSTKLTIDPSEKTSTTAATPAVISDTALADDAEMTIDIDGVGSSVAGAGLKVTLIGKRA